MKIVVFCATAGKLLACRCNAAGFVIEADGGMYSCTKSVTAGALGMEEGCANVGVTCGMVTRPPSFCCTMQVLVLVLVLVDGCGPASGAASYVGFRDLSTGLSRSSLICMHAAPERSRICVGNEYGSGDQKALVAVVAVSDRAGVQEGEGTTLIGWERLP